MLLKLPPGVHKNRAVSMRAPVTCMDRTIRRKMRGKGHSDNSALLREPTRHIYPKTVSMDEKRLHANIAAVLF